MDTCDISVGTPARASAIIVPSASACIGTVLASVHGAVPLLLIPVIAIAATIATGIAATRVVTLLAAATSDHRWLAWMRSSADTAGSDDAGWWAISRSVSERLAAPWWPGCRAIGRLDAVDAALSWIERRPERRDDRRDDVLAGLIASSIFHALAAPVRAGDRDHRDRLVRRASALLMTLRPYADQPIVQHLRGTTEETIGGRIGSDEARMAVQRGRPTPDRRM